MFKDQNEENTWINFFMGSVISLFTPINSLTRRECFSINAGTGILPRTGSPARKTCSLAVRSSWNLGSSRRKRSPFENQISLSQQSSDF